MAWKIVSWSSATRSGEIASHHFAALPFGPSAVPDDAEFTVGEEVVATLDGKPDSYTVSALRKVRFRSEEQPAGTADSVFSWVNDRGFGDLRVDESSTSDLFTLWVGDCCEYCSDAAVIAFKSTSLVQGMDEEGDWDDPYFRRATPDECGAAEVPPGHHAYFIVLTEYEPETSAGFLVVAGEVEITRRPCSRA